MKKLNEVTGMPQMSAAFSGWMSSFTIIKVQQSIVDGFVSEVENPTTYRGTVQPLTPEEIKLKPEGQRSWQWLQIHVIKGQDNLKTDDLIRYNGREYKVMAVKDYSLNNYVEYHLVEDYQNG